MPNSGVFPTFNYLSTERKQHLGCLSMWGYNHSQLFKYYSLCSPAVMHYQSTAQYLPHLSSLSWSWGYNQSRLSGLSGYSLCSHAVILHYQSIAQLLGYHQIGCQVVNCYGKVGSWASPFRNQPGDVTRVWVHDIATIKQLNSKNTLIRLPISSRYF